LSTGSTPYYSNIPPIPIFVRELRKRGYDWAADLLIDAHGLAEEDIPE
jgi:hypothetical protein